MKSPMQDVEAGRSPAEGDGDSGSLGSTGYDRSQSSGDAQSTRLGVEIGLLYALVAFFLATLGSSYQVLTTVVFCIVCALTAAGVLSHIDSEGESLVTNTVVRSSYAATIVLAIAFHWPIVLLASATTMLFHIILECDDLDNAPPKSLLIPYVIGITASLLHTTVTLGFAHYLPDSLVRHLSRGLDVRIFIGVMFLLFMALRSAKEVSGGNQWRDSRWRMFPTITPKSPSGSGSGDWAKFVGSLLRSLNIVVAAVAAFVNLSNKVLSAILVFLGLWGKTMASLIKSLVLYWVVWRIILARFGIFLILLYLGSTAVEQCAAMTKYLTASSFGAGWSVPLVTVGKMAMPILFYLIMYPGARKQLADRLPEVVILILAAVTLARILSFALSYVFDAMLYARRLDISLALSLFFLVCAVMYGLWSTYGQRRSA